MKNFIWNYQDKTIRGWFVNLVITMTILMLVVIGAFIVAALLTPTPDAINQSLMAVPLIVLYELSILVVKFITVTPPVKRKGKSC